MQLLLVFVAFTIHQLLPAVAQCVFGDYVSSSFVINEKCYWLVESTTFTTWESAKEMCNKDGGVITTITSDALNNQLAAKITKPALIGLYRANDYFTLWVNGVDEVNVNREVEGDLTTSHQVVLTNNSSWLAVTVDPEDITEYEVLCDIEYRKLRCSDLVVEASTLVSGQFPSYVSESVTFQCNDSYQYDAFGGKVQTSTCVRGAVWSRSVRDCYRIPICPVPPMLENGFIKETDITDGFTNITYECQKGWVFADGSGLKELTCSRDSPDWNPSYTVTTLECIEVRCNLTELKGGNNMHIGNYNDTLVGSVVTFWCDHGYKMASGSLRVEITCKDAGIGQPYWNSLFLPFCIANTCTSPDVENAVVLGSDAGLQSEVGQSMIYKCPVSTQFPGGITQHQMKCLVSGEWDSIPAQSGCVAAVCQDGWYGYLTNCYYITNNSVGLRYDGANQSCVDKMSSLSTVNNEDEKNQFALIYENFQKEFWIGYHREDGGRWSWLDGGHSNYTNFAPGYPELFRCVRTSVDGLWKDKNCDSPMNYICEKPAVCGLPPNVANADWILKGNFYSTLDAGTIVEYTCRLGYSLSDGTRKFTSTCKLGGIWTWVGSCLETKCPELNSQNYSVENSRVSTDKTHFGVKVTFSCANGFIFPDGSRSNTITCLENRLWSAKIDDCQEIKCSTPATEHAEASWNVSNYGSMDTYTCLQGYKFNDGKSQALFWCGNSGRWSPSNYKCEAVMCPSYYLEHATVSSTDASYPDSIEVTCNEGYRLTDSDTVKTMTCSSEGKWLGDNSTCTARYCDGPLPPQVNNTYRDTNALLGGTIVRYHCTRHYFYSDGSKIRGARCDADTLQWVNIPTPCITYEEYMLANLFTYPDQVLVQGLTISCIVAGAIGVLLGLFKVVAVSLDSRLIKSLHSILKQNNHHVKRRPSFQMINSTPVEFFNIEEDRGQLRQDLPDDTGNETEAEMIRSAEEEEVLETTTGEPQLEGEVDTLSIGTQYNDRYTPDLRNGFEDSSVGAQTPPKSPKPPNRKTEVRKKLKESVVQLKAMKEYYASIPSKLPARPNKVKKRSSKESLDETEPADADEQKDPTPDVGDGKAATENEEVSYHIKVSERAIEGGENQKLEEE